MNTYTRNPTVRLMSNKDDDYYGYDQREARRRDQGHQSTFTHGWRIFSTRRTSPSMMASLSYRRDRARKRHIFLQTYKLGSISSKEKIMRSRKLKKMAVEVKSAVVSVLAFMRGGSLRPCSSRSAIRASSPTRVTKFC